jgi:hypothetical protein
VNAASGVTALRPGLTATSPEGLVIVAVGA